MIQNMVKSVLHFPTEHLQTINCYCSSILGLLWVVLNFLLFFFLTYAINTHLDFRIIFCCYKRFLFS